MKETDRIKATADLVLCFDRLSKLTSKMEDMARKRYVVSIRDSALSCIVSAIASVVLNSPLLSAASMSFMIFCLLHFFPWLNCRNKLNRELEEANKLSRVWKKAIEEG